jgi:hypothetical protein
MHGSSQLCQHRRRNASGGAYIAAQEQRMDGHRGGGLDTYAAIVHGMDTSNVDAVFVAGRVKKWKGELVGVKLDELQRAAERSREHLVARAKWPRTALGGNAPGH